MSQKKCGVLRLVEVRPPTGRRLFSRDRFHYYDKMMGGGIMWESNTPGLFIGLEARRGRR